MICGATEWCARKLGAASWIISSNQSIKKTRESAGMFFGARKGSRQVVSALLSCWPGETHRLPLGGVRFPVSMSFVVVVVLVSCDLGKL